MTNHINMRIIIIIILRLKLSPIPLPNSNLSRWQSQTILIQPLAVVLIRRVALLARLSPVRALSWAVLRSTTAVLIPWRSQPYKRCRSPRVVTPSTPGRYLSSRSPSTWIARLAPDLLVLSIRPRYSIMARWQSSSWMFRIQRQISHVTSGTRWPSWNTPGRIVFSKKFYELWIHFCFLTYFLNLCANYF